MAPAGPAATQPLAPLSWVEPAIQRGRVGRCYVSTRPQADGRLPGESGMPARKVPDVSHAPERQRPNPGTGSQQQPVAQRPKAQACVDDDWRK
jgi:hypothetical protein